MSRQIKRATLAWALLGLVLAPAASALPGASQVGGWWAAAWQVLAAWFDVEASRGAAAAKAGPCIGPNGKPTPGCTPLATEPERKPLRRSGPCIDPDGNTIPGCTK